MREVVFVDGARTAFANMGGDFKDLTATEIGGIAVSGLVKKTGIMERGKLDGLFVGSAFNDAQCYNPARYLVMQSGLPVEVQGHYIEMQCGSGITSINHAAAAIGLGYADCLIAGGMESYSTVPVRVSMNNAPYKNEPLHIYTTHLSPFPEEDVSMIQISDTMAKMYGISREECDEFALRSQQRLEKAYEKDVTGSEIIPYTIPATRKTPERVVDKDAFPKPATTLDGLSKLKSVYAGGVTTAGNASGRNDGAAVVMMMSAEKAEEWGYKPIARWVFGADIGVQPSLMGIGPAYSNFKAMKQAGLKVGDIDVFECNEAFAAQNLGVIREMEKQSGEKIDMEKWNPNGGAIAIGHPNGASGARVAWFAMQQLKQTGGKYGIFTSCCGGGHGTSTIIENLMR